MLDSTVLKLKSLFMIRNSQWLLPTLSTFARFKSIHRKLCVSQCVIAKADKGDTLIALTETKYDAKIRDFLLSSNASPATFSFDYYNTKVRKAIRDSKTIFQTSAAQKAVHNMNYAPPKLYGQLKTHKEGFPVRPVVAFYTDVSYRLAKFLSSWFTLHSAFTPAFTIPNSISLASKLQNQQFPPDSIIVSFDISPGWFTYWSPSI